MQKSVEDVLKKVAERHGVTFDVVKNIWTTQWQYAAFRMRCGKHGDYDTFKFIRLPGMMRLYTTRRKIAKLGVMRSGRAILFELRKRESAEKKEANRIKREGQ